MYFTYEQASAAMDELGSLGFDCDMHSEGIDADSLTVYVYDPIMARAPRAYPGRYDGSAKGIANAGELAAFKAQKPIPLAAGIAARDAIERATEEMGKLADLCRLLIDTGYPGAAKTHAERLSALIDAEQSAIQSTIDHVTLALWEEPSDEEWLDDLTYEAERGRGKLGRLITYRYR